MHDLLPSGRPAMVLAPMQGVTDLPFMRVLARRGTPDWFVTEYFRVHRDSQLHPYVLRSITGNETGRPVFAQLIGGDSASMVRAAQELARFPVAGIDVNLGCPAPIVCRKLAGGGLLRQPHEVDRLLGAMRAAVPGRLTVKTRLGFATAGEFPRLLEIFARHRLDGLTVHARTVHDRYQTPVRPEWIQQAVAQLTCPVIANGNVVDVATGLALHRQSGAAGVMIGRGAIRNPWIFRQLAAAFTGAVEPMPVARDVLEYLLELYDEVARESRRFHPNAHVQRMKKTFAYVSQGLSGEFDYQLRRAKTPDELFHICRDHLDHDISIPVRPPADGKLFCGFETLV